MAAALTFDEYHIKRRALQRRMWNEHGQWIGGADAEAAQVELNALDSEWMNSKPPPPSTVHERGFTWGT